MTHVSAFAIIKDAEGKILLCHRTDRDLWNLPGGGANQNESPWETVLREVREEIGLDITIEKLTGIYHKPQHDEISFAFLCSVRNGEPSLSEEANVIEWFALSDLPSNTSVRQIRRIHDALNVNEFVMRTQ